MPVKRKAKSVRPWPLSMIPNPLIPDSARMFIAKRLIDSIACLLMFVCVFGFLSVFSYDSSDPAFNVAGSFNDIQNIMGHYGAGFADISIQTIGYGTLGGLIVIGVFGYRLLKRKVCVLPASIRLIMFTISLFSLSLCFACFQAPDAWGKNLYMGGVIGTHILNAITHFLPVPHIIIACFGFIIAVISCALAIGYPRDSWTKGWNRFCNTISFINHKFRTTMGWVSHYDALAQSSSTPPPQIDTKPEKRKVLEKMSDAIESVAERVIDTNIEPVVVKPAQSAKTAPQKSLNLKPREDGEWEFPSLDLMQDPPVQKEDQLDEAALQRNAQMLQQVLEDFSIQGEIVKIHPGPVVTLYELEPAPGVKSSRVIGLVDDIARSMSAVSVRAAVVPGRKRNWYRNSKQNTRHCLHCVTS